MCYHTIIIAGDNISILEGIDTYGFRIRARR